MIKSEVASAGKPVSRSRLAQLIVEQHDSLNLGELKVRWDNGSGRVFDPNVAWEPPEQRSNGVVHDWGNQAHLLPAVQQIHVATGMPLMSPKEMQGLLAALAKDVSQQPFSLSDTSYVLKGILLGGHVFGDGEDNPQAFAKSFIKSMRTLCNRDQVALDEAIENDLLEWTAG